ncbi:putative tRNA/rRNA methyltransferase [Pseudomonas aeruginosa]|nr:putative tRNA/rRNA methyltransferase [Pseudomonas aeruginosa]RCH02369.1 putative tRNA/rRNA methyltransferase [Pseudomonas aeruginosa]
MNQRDQAGDQGEYFLAAYTAVNRDFQRNLRPILFLAAYTAVNFLGGPNPQALVFLAAYTAVN